MNRLSLQMLSLLLLLTVSFAVTPLQAEDSKVETPQAQSDAGLSDQAGQLLDEIDELSRQTALMRRRFNEVPEIDRPLFLNLVFAAENRLREKLDQLLKIEVSMLEQGVDVSAIREQLLKTTNNQSIIIRREIAFLNELINQMRKEADQSGDIELATQRGEQEINRLAGAWLDNIERKKRLDLDIQTDLNELSELIQLRAIVQTGRIELLLEKIKLLNTQRKDASEEEQKNIDQQLAVLELRKNTIAENLEQQVGYMKALGMETTEFGQILVIATGEILNKNVDSKAVLGVFGKLTAKAATWLRDNLSLIIFRIVSFFFILLVFSIVAKIVQRLIEKATSSSETSQLLKDFLGSVVSKTIMLIGLIVALSQLGIEIGPLLAGMGVMGFVVGFALQDSLSNFASGLMILFYRPYDIGDFVDVAGINGVVKQMNLVSTTILTADRKRMIIPNSKIWGGIITNVTAEDIRRIDLNFRVGYGDDISKAEQLLFDLVTGHEKVLTEPEPLVRVNALSEYSVDFIVRPWVKTGDYWAVYWDLTRQVKEAFDAAGISIPYPQREVHTIQEGKHTRG